jgi:hypothetical protein
MGEDDAPADRSADIVALTPAPANPESEAKTDAGSPKPPKAQPKAEPAVTRSRGTASTAKKDNRRAAFTLRLDAKRHLKLRLASTVKNRSAQQLVTAALDKYLAEIPEVEALAAQVKRT